MLQVKIKNLGKREICLSKLSVFSVSTLPLGYMIHDNDNALTPNRNDVD
jgi:hypothetical protein